MKTPRTDAVMLAPLRDGNDLPALARQLETEPIAMTAMADSLAEAIAHSPYDDSLAEALAAYEKHKKQTP